MSQACDVFKYLLRGDPDLAARDWEALFARENPEPKTKPPPSEKAG